MVLRKLDALDRCGTHTYDSNTWSSRQKFRSPMACVKLAWLCVKLEEAWNIVGGTEVLIQGYLFKGRDI